MRYGCRDGGDWRYLFVDLRLYFDRVDRGEPMCFFFFFQAEDGIRDLIVTGVQTCALPIYERVLGGAQAEQGRVGAFGEVLPTGRTAQATDAPAFAGPAVGTKVALPALAVEIGRASCRERV